MSMITITNTDTDTRSGLANLLDFTALCAQRTRDAMMKTIREQAAEIDELKERLAEIEHNNRGSEIMFENMLEEIDDLKAQVAGAPKPKDGMVLVLRQMLKDLEKLKPENPELARLAGSIRGLRRDARTLGDAWMKADHKAIRANRQLRLTTERMSELQVEAAGLRAKVRRLEAKVSEPRVQPDHPEESVRRWSERLRDQRKEIKRMNAQAAIRARDAKIDERKIKEQARRIKDLEDQLASEERLHAYNAALGGKRAGKEEEEDPRVEELEEKLETADSECHARDCQIEELEKLVGELRNELAARKISNQQTIDDLRSSLKAASIMDAKQGAIKAYAEGFEDGRLAGLGSEDGKFAAQESDSEEDDWEIVDENRPEPKGHFLPVENVDERKQPTPTTHLIFAEDDPFWNHNFLRPVNPHMAEQVITWSEELQYCVAVTAQTSGNELTLDDLVEDRKKPYLRELVEEFADRFVQVVSVPHMTTWAIHVYREA